MKKQKWTTDDKENAKVLVAYQVIKELQKEGKITKTQLDAIRNKYNISVD